MPTSTYSFPERLFKGLGAMGGIFATGRPFDVTTATDVAKEEEARALVQRLQQLQAQGAEQNLATGKIQQGMLQTQANQLPVQLSRETQIFNQGQEDRKRGGLLQLYNTFDTSGVADPTVQRDQLLAGNVPTMSVRAGQPVANMLFGMGQLPQIGPVLQAAGEAMAVNPTVFNFDNVPLALKRDPKSLHITADGLVVNATTGQKVNDLRQPKQPTNRSYLEQLQELVRAGDAGDEIALKTLAKLKELRGGNNFEDALNSLVNGQPATVTTAGKPAGASMKQYADEAQATAAAQRGELKPGERVMIGGVSGTWR